MRLSRMLAGAAVTLLVAAAPAPSRPAKEDGKGDQARYVYEQTTGNLYLVAGADRTLLGTGYSGTGDGRNNPDMQGARNVGPIPQGLWRIGDAHDSAKTGKLVMDLTPVGHGAGPLRLPNPRRQRQDARRLPRLHRHRPGSPGEDRLRRRP